MNEMWPYDDVVNPDADADADHATLQVVRDILDRT